MSKTRTFRPRWRPSEAQRQRITLVKTDLSNQSGQRRGGCVVYYMRLLNGLLTGLTVHERICPTSQTTVETLIRHWHEGLLEVVYYAIWFPHYALWIERRSMGWDAVPLALQRRTRHVYAHL